MSPRQPGHGPGRQRITNFGGAAAGAGGGLTQFTDSATAGTSTLVMAAGVTAGASGGQVSFFSGATAGSATLNLRGADGDPVTLTLLDSLTWDGGGLIHLVLGADTEGSDQVHV